MKDGYSTEVRLAPTLKGACYALSAMVRASEALQGITTGHGERGGAQGFCGGRQWSEDSAGLRSAAWWSPSSWQGVVKAPAGLGLLLLC